ncbi:MAG: tetratricopeptide repeat-containing sulfotransferase family protein [Gammaproteobacteria bacterium]
MALEFTLPPAAPAGLARALALFRQRDYVSAEAICRKILEDTPAQSQALHLLALVLADTGDSAQAMSCIEQARQQDPQNPALLGAHALLLLRANRLEEAEAEARAALAVQPLLPDVLDVLGAVRWRRGDTAEARENFTQALEQNPAHTGAFGDLALLAEQSNDVAEAERLAAEGLARRPDDVMLLMVHGRCLRRREDWTGARAVFERLAQQGTAVLRRDAEYELVLCHAALGDAGSAFAHAERANHLARQNAPQALADARDFMAQIHYLERRFTREWVAAWQPLETTSAGPMPAFLAGFARSGTTLLDSMLGAHPGIALLEERGTELAMIRVLDSLPGGYPEALLKLTATEYGRVLAAYRSAAKPQDSGGRLLLDKSPFLTVHAGLVQRIFPGAPLIFMVRHPCDVVLSAFLTNLELNSGSAHFTRLGSSVDLYCSVMSLWQRYREVLPLHCLVLRYEDLLDDPRTVLGRALDFLGLPWSERVLHHTEHVATRGPINTASYAQVSRPLYQSSRGRWQRYRKYLEPYLARLEPYCRYFGYAL